MPALPSPSTWRTHPQSQDVRLFILTPTVVIRRAINQATFTYPVATLTFDNPGGNPGDYTDTQIGQTIAVYDSTGDTLKGLVRLRSTTNPTVLYISPTSQGDINFEDNDVLEVWDEYRVWPKIPRLDESGTQFKDWDVAFLSATASQPPVANAGSWVANACPVGGSITIPFDGTGSYAVAEGATIVGYLWDMADGSYITGSSTSSAPTVSFPAGFRWISLRVEDSNGWTHTARALVVTDDGTLSTRLSVSRLGGTVEGGWEGSFALLENDLSGFPDGACVILWAVERYGVTQGSLNGPAGRQQVKFCGWLVEELDTVEPLLSDVVVNAISALGFLGHLPAFSMTTEYAPTPTDWTQIANMTFWRQAQYLMQWHSTLLDVCDVLRPDYYALYPYPRLNATEGMLDEQLQFVANAVGARVTCDQRNIIYWRKNPQLMTAAERATVATVVTLADTDWAESLPVRKRYDKQVSVVRAIAGVSNQTDVLTIAAVAPGASPGQEGGQEQLPNLLVFSQDDLNERLGRYYAWKNLSIPELPMTVFLQGMVNDPAWQEYAFFTLNADSNRRGLAIENQPYLLNSVDVTFNHEQGTSMEQWSLETLTSAVGVASALTQQLPGAEPPTDGEYISSDGFYIDPLVTDPYTGPDWYDVPPPDYAYVAPVDYVPNDVSTPSSDDASAYFAWNNVFARTNNPSNASPSWLTVFPVVNGSVITAVSNPTANTGWLLTDGTPGKLWYTPDDLRSGTPAWSDMQDVSGGYLLRHIPGISGGGGIAVFTGRDETEWTENFDLSASQDPWEPRLYPDPPWTGDPMAVYTPGVGFEDVLFTNISPNMSNRYLHIYVMFGSQRTITEVEYEMAITFGTGVAQENNLYIVTDPVNPPNSATLIHSFGTDTGGIYNWTGSETGYGVLFAVNVGIRFDTTDPGGTATLTAASISGLGTNPFDPDMSTVIVSDDAGATIVTTNIGDDMGDRAGDVDDFNLGVIIGAAENEIRYTSSYVGAFSVLSGLTGINQVVITAIRIPYRKLASQSLNNDKTALQFIYGTETSVGGATLWAVTFNVNTGVILAQIDITPIISTTTYAVFAPNGLETYGGNTQRIKAFAQPDGGGTIRLLGSDDGGDAWTSRSTGFDGVQVMHLPPNLGGNGQKIVVAGPDGIASSVNGGVNFTDRTGDFAAETGETEAFGVFVL